MGLLRLLPVRVLVACAATGLVFWLGLEVRALAELHDQLILATGGLAGVLLCTRSGVAALATGAALDLAVRTRYGVPVHDDSVVHALGVVVMTALIGFWLWRLAASQRAGQLQLQRIESALGLIRGWMLVRDSRTNALRELMCGPRPLGYDRRSFGEHALDEALHPDDRAALPARRSELRQTGRVRFRSRLRDAEGRWRTFDNHVVHAIEADGVPSYWGVSLDVTETAELEDWLQTVFDTDAVGINVSDETRHIVTCNAELARILGRTKQELVGMYVPQLFADERPDIEARMEAVLHGEVNAITYERTYVRGDGTLVWCRVTTERVPSDPVRFVTFAQDISEQHAAQERLEALAAALGRAELTGRFGTWTWEPAAASGRRSPGAEAILGAGQDADAAPWHAVADDDAEALRSALETAVHGTAFDIECRLAGCGGATRFVRLAGHAETGADGTQRVVGVVHDITDEHLAQERLQQVVRVEALGQVASGVAHDFNNLMLVVDGYGRLALQERPGDENVEAILDAGRRASELTRKLLLFARNTSVPPAPIDVCELVRSLARMLERVVPASLAVRVEVPDTPLHVFADAADLNQTAFNLALNARDAMPDGGQLTLAVAATRSASGPTVTLSVADTGHGMDAVTLERIFTPFFTTKPAGKGTGIGLSIVKGAVQRAGGAVRVESTPGAGTVFRVELPRHGSDPDEHPADRRRHILLVADSEVSRELMRTVLESDGHAVTAAVSPDEALAAALAVPGLDLVVVDIAAPGPDGRSFARELRLTGLTAPVLFVSGDFRPADPGEQSEPGAAFLAKPFVPGELSAAVSALLG